MSSLKAVKEKLAKLQQKQRENPILFARVADCLLQLRKFKEAQKVLTEGLVKYPNYPAGWLVRGNYHLMRQELEEAQRAFEKALQLDPVNPYALERCSQFAEDRKNLKVYRKYRIALTYLDPMNGEYQRMLQLDLLRRVAVHEGVYSAESADNATLAELRHDLLKYDLLPEKLRRRFLREAQWAADESEEETVDLESEEEAEEADEDDEYDEYEEEEEGYYDEYDDPEAEHAHRDF